MLKTLTAYADWCVQERGLRLDRKQVFTLAVIDEFVAQPHPGLAQATVGNYRSHLVRTTKLLNPSAAPSERPHVPPSAGSKPYGNTELKKLWTWAHGLPTLALRQDAEFLLAGCLGAGLTGREVCDVRRSDIIIDGSGVLVRVSQPRVRLVPVHSELSHVLIAARARTSADDFVFLPGRDKSAKNTVSNFIARNTPTGEPVSTQRARATWVVRQLNSGVRIDVLMKAMGLGDFSAIARYLQYVDRVDTCLYRSLLHGATPPFSERAAA
ncbi:site-specific integrase [Demequina sp. NBRC 110054]|uniref:site-specific integrase n=1 Tax=Demequina sp. NBRC 110054 TaxID=1570343 RepID=UPI000A02A158|nr:site-specific integrase [Demequina sp. NBRC 110054]